MKGTKVMGNKLRDAKVAVFGAGCVGGYTAEILAKNGLGALELIDGSKVGQSKNGCFKTNGVSDMQMFRVELEKQRLVRMYPDTKVKINRSSFSVENISQYDFAGYGYIIDTLAEPEKKLALAVCAEQYHLPLISCLDTNNRSNPTQLRLMAVDKVPDPFVPSWMRLLCDRRPEKWKVLYSEERLQFSGRYSIVRSCLDCACPPDTAFVCRQRRIAKNCCNVYVSAMAGMLAGEEILMYLAHWEGGK